jgi:hypothetical protein
MSSPIVLLIGSGWNDVRFDEMGSSIEPWINWYAETS